MHLSIFKKLALCALGSVLIVWSISKFENVMVSSNSIKDRKTNNSSNIIEDSMKSNTTTRKIEAGVSDTLKLLAFADIKSGQSIFRKCKSCHTTQIDGRSKIGPNLWNIVGRPKASVSGYRFSKALRKMGGYWNYKDLDKFITNPKKFVKGTKMSFAGIKSNKGRADLIFFLRSLSDQPKLLP
jgi:cytochrome c